MGYEWDIIGTDVLSDLFRCIGAFNFETIGQSKAAMTDPTLPPFYPFIYNMRFPWRHAEKRLSFCWLIAIFDSKKEIHISEASLCRHFMALQVVTVIFELPIFAKAQWLPGKVLAKSQEWNW